MGSEGWWLRQEQRLLDTTSVAHKICVRVSRLTYILYIAHKTHTKHTHTKHTYMCVYVEMYTGPYTRPVQTNCPPLTPPPPTLPPACLFTQIRTNKLPLQIITAALSLYLPGRPVAALHVVGPGPLLARAPRPLPPSLGYAQPPGPAGPLPV